MGVEAGNPCAADCGARLLDRRWSGMFTKPAAADHPALFTCFDRCDRCGAAAHMRVILRTGVLLLCGHHGRQHHARLIEAGAAIEVE